MKKTLYVSTGKEVCAYALSGDLIRRTAMEESGILCAAKKHVWCTRRREICRLDRRSLMLEAVLPGGPSVCDLCLSDDQTRLFALCEDADSVLMLDARNGQPLALKSIGSAPKQMLKVKQTLVVAGGEYNCVFLVSDDNLETERTLMAPGPVYGVAISGAGVHALCLTQWLDSLLMTIRPCGSRSILTLSGMPGCLLLRRNMLMAATQQQIYAITPDGGKVLWHRPAPGRIGRLLEAGNRLFACDGIGERLLACDLRGRRWTTIREEARDISLNTEE